MLCSKINSVGFHSPPRLHCYHLYTFSAGGSIDTMILRHGANILTDETTIGTAVAQGRALHLVLARKHSTALPPLQVSLLSDSVSPLESIIELSMQDEISHVLDDGSHSLEVRGWLDQPIAGTSIYEPATRSLKFCVRGVEREK